MMAPYLRPNRYRGVCPSCGGLVPARRGVLHRTGPRRSWSVWHVACMQARLAVLERGPCYEGRILADDEEDPSWWT